MQGISDAMRHCTSLGMSMSTAGAAPSASGQPPQSASMPSSISCSGQQPTPAASALVSQRHQQHVVIVHISVVLLHLKVVLYS